MQHTGTKPRAYADMAAQVPVCTYTWGLRHASSCTPHPTASHYTPHTRVEDREEATSSTPPCIAPPQGCTSQHMHMRTRDAYSTASPLPCPKARRAGNAARPGKQSCTRNTTPSSRPGVHKPLGCSFRARHPADLSNRHMQGTGQVGEEGNMGRV